VLAFHEAFDLPRQALPNAHVAEALAELRVDLLCEEVQEFADATKQRNLVGLADALADIVYVAYGTAITYGIDLDEVIAEVHLSNMSKLGRSGRPLLRDDGKVLKPPCYRPPDVTRVLEEQLPLFENSEVSSGRMGRDASPEPGTGLRMVQQGTANGPQSNVGARP